MALSQNGYDSEVVIKIINQMLKCLSALDLWDLIVSVLGNVSRVSNRSGQLDNDVNKHNKSQKRINVMENIDSVPSNVQFSHQKALFFVFEDNEAVIKMIIKEKSPTMNETCVQNPQRCF